MATRESSRRVHFAEVAKESSDERGENADRQRHGEQSGDTLDSSSTVFPPIRQRHSFAGPGRHRVRAERTVVRDPSIDRSKFTVFASSVTQHHDRHWRLPPPRVFTESLDTRIVRHLRRKLNRRLDQRLTQLSGEELHQVNAEKMAGLAGSRWNTPAGPLQESRLDIFATYDDFGERVKKTSLSLNDLSGVHLKNKIKLTPFSPKDVKRMRAKTLRHTGDRYLTPRLSPTKNRRIEPIPRKSLEESTQYNDENLRDDDAESEIPREASLFTLTRPKDVNGKREGSTDESDELGGSRESDVGDEEAVERDVSPVPTPDMSRTRPLSAWERSHVEEEERIAMILRGQMNVKCHPHSRQLQLFLQSNPTDMATECGALIQKVYPRLKTFCLERGYDLRIIDPYWGSREVISDNHADIDMTLNLIDEVTQANTGFINFITLLGQKYGPLQLPGTLPADEFEAILAASEAQQKLLAPRDEEPLQDAPSPTPMPASFNYGEKQETREMANPQANPMLPVSMSSVDNTKRITFALPGSTRPATGASMTLTSPLKMPMSRESSYVNAGDDNPASTRMRTPGEISGKRKLSSIMRDGGIINKDLIEPPDPELLVSWYKLDENVVPPVYRLQNISSHYPDITRSDASKRALARSSWQDTRRRLQRQLQAYASRALHQNSHMLAKFNSSASELELTRGILTNADARSHCFWFRRDITEFSESLGDAAIKDYIDLHPLHGTRDAAMSSNLRVLSEENIQRLLPLSSIRKYTVAWNSKGIDPSSSRSHFVYVDRLCRDFYDIISRSLEDWYACQPDINNDKTALLHEIEEHVHFCQMRCQMMHGRKDILNAIKQYIRGPSRTPFVVHGRAGCGKTAIMAKAGQQTYKWFKRQGDVSTLVRVIGVTGQSTNVRLLLRSLCIQLCYVFGKDPTQTPNDFKGLFNMFIDRLSLATPTKPVVVFLSSLHNLSDENDARKLSWLPPQLPHCVKLIVSTLSDDKYDCLPALRKILPFHATEGDGVFLEVPTMPLQDAAAVLDHWYHQSGRTVTERQRHLLLKCFTSCPTPLYLRLIFKESLRWSSSFDVSEVKLGSAVKNVVTVMLGRLEKEHREPLVRRAVGYITASRHGITANELEDLLSLDEAVMDDVCPLLKLDIRRLPSILVLRLIHDMSEYLEESNVDHCTTLKWRFGQFHEAATERYLVSRDKAPSYHKAMSEYFLDMWSNKPKPCAYNEKGVLRYVTPQPLYREGIEGDSRSLGRVYNQRKLNELPYHLIKAQQMTILKAQCLCNFEFVLAKISSTSLRSFFEDLYMALTLEPNDSDLKLLSDTLHLATSVLMKDPNQLASQIVGRLQSIITKDLPIAPSDPVQFPALKPFYRQALYGSVPAILPSITCLSPPGGVLFDLLSGHAEPITAIVLSQDGQKAITSSKDNSLKVWELKTGRVAKTICSVGRQVRQIRLAGNDQLAITSETNKIRVWSLQTGECFQTIHSNDPASITVANDGQTLVAFFHGATSMKCWKLSDDFSSSFNANLSEIDEHPLNECIHQDDTTVVASSAMGPWVLHAFKDSSYGMVRNVTTGNLVFKLQCKESGAITAVAIAREYFICVVRSRLKGDIEICTLELFEVTNGKHFRSITGCANDIVDELHVNQTGSHAIAICHSEACHASDIAVWNLETEEHKHLAKHAGVSQFGACIDMRCIVTASAEENTLRIWNLSGKINQPVPKAKVKEGIDQLLVLKDHPRYIMAKSVNSGPLVLWNIVKKKLAGCVMRSDRGLAEASDIVLLNNTKLVILADKGFSRISNDDQPIYQSIIIFDILAKKFIRKLTGCYIFPAPEHEYVILDDGHLLGLSDNRNHFVVWSLATGHIVYRIKTSFRHSDRTNTVHDKTDAVNDGAKRHSTPHVTSRLKKSELHASTKLKHQDELDQARLHQEELHLEKENAIEEYLISKDLTTIVAAFYAHHLCVFNVPTQSHIQTLENPSSMLFLHIAALTHSGCHLVHTNYDDKDKTSYVTLWNCQTGNVRRRLKHEKNVHAIAVSDDAGRVVFGKSNRELRIWDPFKPHSLRKIRGYTSLEFGVGSQIHIVDNGCRAIVFAGDVSIWDLENATVLAVFTPDMKIHTLSVAMDGNLIIFGMRDSSEIVSLRLAVRGAEPFQRSGEYLFDEVDSSDDEEEDDEEEEDEDEE